MFAHVLLLHLVSILKGPRPLDGHGTAMNDWGPVAEFCVHFFIYNTKSKRLFAVGLKYLHVCEQAKHPPKQPAKASRNIQTHPPNTSKT